MKQSNIQQQSGFTLVELVVAVAIFAIITGLFLARSDKFGNQIILESLAYDIALSVRQAQVFGLSVRSTDGGIFTGGYGVYFSTSTPQQYLLFADTDDDNLYDSGEEVEVFTISRGNYISSVCAHSSSGGTDCGLDYATAVFERPEPEALFNSNKGTLPGLRIYVTSPKKETKWITVTSAGQISVE